MYMLQGISSVVNFITAYEELSNSHFLSVMCSMFPKMYSVFPKTIFFTFI